MRTDHYALPADLPDVFRVTQAQALGVGVGRLRGADLGRPCRGVRSSSPYVTPTERLRALGLVLPSTAVFSHDTAAQLLELPMPLQHNDDDVVHVMTPPGSPRVGRAGVLGHRGAPAAVLTVGGLRVSDPTSTWLDLAATWAVDDLVVAADAILRRSECGLPELTCAVDGAAGRRGAQAMRSALPLVRAGSRSPMESRARLIMLRGCLPEPELNIEVHDPRTGEWLATPDFVWRRRRVAAEYQGDHHRTDRAQWETDIVRIRRMQEAGWRVVLFTADDVLRRPRRLLESLRAALV